MFVRDWFLNHKIGAFELLLVDVFLELFFGSRLRVLVALALCTLAYIAKAKFKGEFSLADTLTLFEVKASTKPAAPTSSGPSSPTQN